MVPRERLLQLARLIGVDVFRERFGPPQSAEPAESPLRLLIDERLDQIAEALVEETAASDDVIDRASAEAYLEDRLRTFGDMFSAEQAEQIRAAFREGTARW